jgi:phage baseplate assembly protein gpV
MVSHEFLDDTLRKQRATYSDGTTVTIDLAAKTYTVEPAIAQ